MKEVNSSHVCYHMLMSRRCRGCAIVVTEEDWSREVDSDVESNSVSLVPPRGRRIRQLLRLPTTCQSAFTLLCY